MAKRMLIDATQPEETRVVVLNGNRLDELDFEIASRKQLKGNIYLAKVTRVEPSLQAAFVEYGGNRHGFLAFSEIHPDYYRIPVADREALMAEARRMDEYLDAEDADEENGERLPLPSFEEGCVVSSEEEASSGESRALLSAPEDVVAAAPEAGSEASPEAMATESVEFSEAGENGSDLPEAAVAQPQSEPGPAGEAGEGEGDVLALPVRQENYDVVGGDEVEETVRRRPRPLRSYKIQEVIKRRQILLVQVTKEERGNKGAALTTYLSLPGRYCVLMPNTGRGGGISRKITNPQDRRRLKEVLSGLDIPSGMAVILRTAGMERSRAEIQRDLEYLLRLWDSIAELTLRSTAPELIYEEANLIKRSIRDLYSNDIDEVQVEGEVGYQTAKDFMRMLVPGQSRKVQLYRDETIPLFHRYQIEAQIDAIHNPVVQLKSGGYIVINPTEALVAIDVNSGKSTRERNIEETALRTNIEAADEVARQLKLRDLAGLIVIDFIDMEDPRNNSAVERRIKEAMKNDRARIQLGRISPFGLLELSRQRLRPSVIETNFERCPHCSGVGMIRSVESSSLHAMRAVEDEGVRKRSAEISITVPGRVALYILNQKRAELVRAEQRYGMRVSIQVDDSLIAPEYRLERLRARMPGDERSGVVTTDRIWSEAEPGDDDLRAVSQDSLGADEPDEAGDREPEGASAAPAAGAAQEAGGRDRRRRRRRRRFEDRGAGIDGAAAAAAGHGSGGPGDEGAAAEGAAVAGGEEAQAPGTPPVPANGDSEADSADRRRRRGRRGGRRRGRGRDGVAGLGAPENGAQGVEGFAGDGMDEAGLAFDLDGEGEGDSQGDAGGEAPRVAPGLVASAIAAPAAIPVMATVSDAADFDWFFDGDQPAPEVPVAVSVSVPAPAPQPVTTAGAEEEGAPAPESAGAEVSGAEDGAAEAPAEVAPRRRRRRAAPAAGAEPDAAEEAAPPRRTRTRRRPAAEPEAAAAAAEAEVVETEADTASAAEPEVAPAQAVTPEMAPAAVTPETAPAAVTPETAPAAVTPETADAPVAAAAPAAAPTPEPAPAPEPPPEPLASFLVTEPLGPPRRGWWSKAKG